MAGFWDKPFNLSRNSISPSLELQRTIFPWIKDHFECDNAAWKKVCDKEIKEVDENEDGRMVQQRIKQIKKKHLAVQRSTDTAKRGFLRLLIRCRRVILQDAAVYIYLKKENSLVNTNVERNVLSSNPFLSAEFKLFQDSIVEAITTPSINRLQEYECLVPNIVDSQKEVSTRLGEISHQMINIQQQSTRQFARVENYFHDQNQDSSRVESILVGLCQQL
ncbi:hypothetical protein CLU79DRAFT_753236 [Phycomyces nitens]|nr:hypothetical protein CLU79DRAFT_753236 [Phycomyces nitens]